MAKEKNIYQPRLIRKYHDKVADNLSVKLDIKNVMRLPKIEKIVLNMGIGDASENANSLKSAVEELTAISGQKAVLGTLQLTICLLLYVYLLRLVHIHIQHVSLF